jgi:hypothetical protein
MDQAIVATVVACLVIAAAIALAPTFVSAFRSLWS